MIPEEIVGATTESLLQALKPILRVRRFYASALVDFGQTTHPDFRKGIENEVTKLEKQILSILKIQIEDHDS